MNGLVSVIMPIYNSEKYLFSSISSVLNQSYREFELILVDDASSDRSSEIYNSFVDDRIRILKFSANQGVSAARNYALSKSNGEYISFCDSDDIWFPEKLSEQIKLMNSAGVGICSSSALLIDSNDKVIGRRDSPSHITKSSMEYRNYLINSSTLVKADLIKGVRFSAISHEDYLFWLEVFKTNEVTVVSSKDPFIYYRVHSDSLSSNKIKAIWWHVGVWRAAEYSPFMIMKCLIKNLVSRL